MIGIKRTEKAIVLNGGFIEIEFPVKSKTIVKESRNYPKHKTLRKDRKR